MSALYSYLVEMFDLIFLLHPQSITLLHQALCTFLGFDLQVTQWLVLLTGQVCLMDFMLPFICNFLDKKCIKSA